MKASSSSGAIIMDAADLLGGSDDDEQIDEKITSGFRVDLSDEDSDEKATKFLKKDPAKDAQRTALKGPRKFMG